MRYWGVHVGNKHHSLHPSMLSKKMRLLSLIEQLSEVVGLKPSWIANYGICLHLSLHLSSTRTTADLTVGQIQKI